MKTSLFKSISLIAILCIIAPAIYADTAKSTFSDDTQTLFLAHFDNSLDANSASGSQRASGQAGLTTGQFAQSVSLQNGLCESPEGLKLPFMPLRYETSGNIDPRQGTLEFWVSPSFSPAQTGSFGTNYYLLDCWNNQGFRLILQDDLKGGRTLQWFEKASSAMPQWTLTAPLQNWTANSWHHVAVVWAGNYRALYIDGILAAKKNSPYATLPIESTLTVGASIYNTWPAQAKLDELRISSIARYGENGTSPLPQPSPPTIPATPKLQWQSESPSISEVTGQISNDTSNGLTLPKVLLENKSNAPQNVKVWLDVPTHLNGVWHFWDGRAARRGQAGQWMQQDEMMNTFPLACAYDGEQGVAVGLDAGELRSWFGSRVWMSSNGSGMIRFETKTVLAPNSSDTVRFVRFSFTPEFQYLNAVQKYQDAFPHYFNAASDIDPRVLSGSMVGGAFYGDPNKEPGAPMYSIPEIARRAGANWEWAYAPIKYGGDFLVRPQWWNLRKIPPGKASPEIYEATPDAFLAARKKQFDAMAKRGVAPMFYFINWVDEVLKDEYNDALIAPEDAHDHRGVKISSWVKSYSTDLRAFEWGTKLGDNIKSDMKALVQQLPISGFAHDVSCGGAFYRGPGMWKTPGRAYDERGPYVEEGIGMAMMLDYVHSLHNSQYRLGTTGNPTPTAFYGIPFRLDNSIYEGRVDEALSQQAQMEQSRLLMGSKPRSLYLRNNGWKFGKRLDVDKMSATELRDFYHHLWDYSLLFALHEGYHLPPDLIFGYERTARIAPLLNQIVETGWQPVTAMKSSTPLWLARYGHGDNSILVILNPRDHEVDATITAEQKYFSEDQSLLFASSDGSATPQIVYDGKSTFTMKLPSRGTLILQAVAKIPAGANFNGNVSQHWQTEDGEIIVSPTPAGLQYIPRKYFSHSNGKFQSTIFEITQKDISDFDWRNATIIKSQTSQDWAAWRVQEYFRFVKEAIPTSKISQILPIATDAAQGKPAIILQNGNTLKIQQQGNRLILQAPENQWPLLLNLFFAQLDKQFPFVGDWSVYQPHLNPEAIPDSATKQAMLKMGFPGVLFSHDF